MLKRSFVNELDFHLEEASSSGQLEKYVSQGEFVQFKIGELIIAHNILEPNDDVWSIRTNEDIMYQKAVGQFGLYYHLGFDQLIRRWSFRSRYNRFRTETNRILNETEDLNHALTLASQLNINSPSFEYLAKLTILETNKLRGNILINLNPGQVI